MSVENSPTSLKESISLMTATIKANTQKITSLYERMDTTGTAIAGCRKTLEGLELLKQAYAKAKTNDLEAFAEQFDFVAEFCTAKLERWQQYWVSLNNEAAQLQHDTKALQFKWEEERSRYNRMVKSDEKKGKR